MVATVHSYVEGRRQERPFYGLPWCRGKGRAHGLTRRACTNQSGAHAQLPPSQEDQPKLVLDQQLGQRDLPELRQCGNPHHRRMAVWRGEFTNSGSPRGGIRGLDGHTRTLLRVGNHPGTEGLAGLAEDTGCF